RSSPERCRAEERKAVPERQLLHGDHVVLGPRCHPSPPWARVGRERQVDQSRRRAQLYRPHLAALWGLTAREGRGTPGGPIAPAGPVVPASPCSPWGPDGPAGPGTPWGPIAPGTPGGPIAP